MTSIISSSLIFFKVLAIAERIQYVIQRNRLSLPISSLQT